MKNTPIRRTPERSTIGVNKEEIQFLKDCCSTINEKTGELLSWSEFGKYIMMNYAEEGLETLIEEIKNQKK